ncbi:MAG: radical SAM protein [Candidatus Omnitrophica bacterium]|nr:radical SAM protein [Candidatus Omnitrophota bacterium]
MKSRIKNVHLIRTFIPVGTGGPIPPLEMLYVASQLRRDFGDTLHLRLTDTGVGSLSEDDIRDEWREFAPDLVILYALSWEAGLVHALAAAVKELHPDTTVVVFGQLATFSSQYLCEDPHIDFVVVGEPELTVAQLVGALREQCEDLSGINGLAYRIHGAVTTTAPREYPDNIDAFEIIPEMWDAIDIRRYAQYENWNGAIKEDFYIPILTQRGCPFKCTFCRETYGKKFHARSPEHVLAEIKFLHERYGAREFHIYDPVFNYDQDRAKRICQLIIDAGLPISLAFPHGVRADIMTEELLTLMRRAGTYKLVYGIESASRRLQKAFRKNLNLEQVREIIRVTADKGIITGGYFMLGHLSETAGEIEETIRFAVTSDLDVASFFKATDYDDVNKIYASKFKDNLDDTDIFAGIRDIAYYAVNRSQAAVDAAELNRLVLSAQRRFYFHPRRIWRGFGRYPSKRKYIKNLLTAAGLILQGYIVQSLAADTTAKKPAAEAVAHSHA